jgi:hypothetical protein
MAIELYYRLIHAGPMALKSAHCTFGIVRRTLLVELRCYLGPERFLGLVIAKTASFVASTQHEAKRVLSSFFIFFPRGSLDGVISRSDGFGFALDALAFDSDGIACVLLDVGVSISGGIGFGDESPEFEAMFWLSDIFVL